MKSIERRIKKIEQMLNMDGSQRFGAVLVLSDENCPEQEALPQNIEEWIIYKEKQRKAKQSIGYSGPTVTILFASDEVEARKLKGLKI